MKAPGLLGVLAVLLITGYSVASAAKRDTETESESEAYPADCEDIGSETSGLHVIYPAGPHSAVPVYCDMTTDDGKWTVIQKRFNGSVTFFRGWADYKLGFGRADSEYWFGLHNVYQLTLKRKYELRVDLRDFENNTAFAKYNDFALSPNAINPEEDGYTLYLEGFVDGGAGDALSYHSGMKFSTYDSDRDTFPQNCAALSSGGFWFKSCHQANLNGPYLGGVHLSYASGIIWSPWKGFYYSLKSTEMKIRRV